jgi:hypothetical protein
MRAAAAGLVKEPLRKAAELKWWGACAALLECLDDLKGKDGIQHSIALYHAAQAGQAGLVQGLLSKGAWAELPWTNDINGGELSTISTGE